LHRLLGGGVGGVLAELRAGGDDGVAPRVEDVVAVARGEGDVVGVVGAIGVKPIWRSRSAAADGPAPARTAAPPKKVPTAAARLPPRTPRRLTWSARMSAKCALSVGLVLSSSEPVAVSRSSKDTGGISWGKAKELAYGRNPT
jgi:hypothetical protein